MCSFKARERFIYQRQQRSSSLHCCVSQCYNSSRYNSEISFHSFPIDAKIRAQWVAKIRRDKFIPTINTRVCSRHFQKSDFAAPAAGGLRRLNKGAVPSLFAWNEFRDPTAGPGDPQRGSRSSAPASLSGSGPDTVSEVWDEKSALKHHDYCLSSAPVTPITGTGAANENEALRRKTEELEGGLESVQLQSRFGLSRFGGSDDDIRFYTRFATYSLFMAFWRLIEPAVTIRMEHVARAKAASEDSDELTQQRATKLAPIDELLLYLMHLSVGLHLRDLAHRFGIHRTAVSRIILTWTKFLYSLLGSVHLWIPPAAVKARLPPEFGRYPDTQVVLDCTEISCQTSSSLPSQREVHSTYKSHCTFKAMIGIAPHGPITFVSTLYPGSASDREVFKKSGIIPLLTPEMAIMVNKGFLVEDLIPCKVYRPARVSEGTQMCGEETQSVAPLRVHVERCMQRVKENKLFDRVVPLSVTGSIGQLFSVACFLVNYQN